jgi:hypothetical protein
MLSLNLILIRCSRADRGNDCLVPTIFHDTVEPRLICGILELELELEWQTLPVDWGWASDGNKPNASNHLGRAPYAIARMLTEPQWIAT